MNWKLLTNPVNMVILIGVIVLIWFCFFQITQAIQEGRTPSVDPAAPPAA